MLRIGDSVVVMSAPGIFTVVALNGNVATIENAAGIQKVVLIQAVRRIERPAAAP
ncbi:MAG: hypothetical protein HY699_03530 [Deltaproteobacteria bacterium]|nr:hypothetical protein [Deltaproteobacteria bacterium]